MKHQHSFLVIQEKEFDKCDTFLHMNETHKMKN